jgi:hypothetical protein
MPVHGRCAMVRPDMQAVAWYDELQRIAGNAAKLTPCAREAVKSVVVSILGEGEKCPAGIEVVLAAFGDD